jgi:hypothetical protein
MTIMMMTTAPMMVMAGCGSDDPSKFGSIRVLMVMELCKTQ